MIKVDLDFQRFIERRKGLREAEAREGASYAYAGDLRLLRTLGRIGPVRSAIESVGRQWEKSRAELLAGAERATPSLHKDVYASAARAGKALHVEPPIVFVTHAPLPGHVGVFGNDDEALLLLGDDLRRRLDEDELLDVLARELGRIQNRHTVFVAAHYYLTHRAATVVRWAVSPALITLDGWARRAAITADRAGLIASRNLRASTSALAKLFADDTALAGVSAEALLAAVKSDEAAKPDAAAPEAVLALFSQYPLLRKRIGALKVFADSAYYRGMLGEPGGHSSSECDKRVAEILA